MVVSGGSGGDGAAGSCCVTVCGGKEVSVDRLVSSRPHRSAVPHSSPRRGAQSEANRLDNSGVGGGRSMVADGAHTHTTPKQVSVDTTTQKSRSMCRSRCRATEGPQSSSPSCSFSWVFLFKSRASRHRPHRDPAKGEVDHQEHDGGVRWAGDSRR